MSTADNQELWSKLFQLSRTWKGLFHTPSSPSNSQHAPPSPAPLSLSVPTDFYDFLSTLNLPQDVASQASRKIQTTLQELKAIHVRNYDQMCQNAIQTNRDLPTASQTVVFDTVRFACEASFQQQAPRIKEEFLKSYERLRSQERSEQKRAPFNAEYTPLLEKYFEYQPYPSPRDREWLARKTMMTVRQIDVWFQNHRRRGRQEGREFAKVPMDQLPRQLSLESLEEQLSPLAMPKRKKSETPERAFATPPPENEVQTSNKPSVEFARGNTVLDCTDAPSHAYPLSFKESHPLADEAFPCRRGVFKFASPVWDRKPATRPPRHEPCTIDELCARFTIHIAGPKVVRDPSVDPWYAHRCIGPIGAPHPALVRPSPSSSSSSHRSPSPSPSLTSLSPPSAAKQSSSRRSATPRQKTPKSSSSNRKRRTTSNDRLTPLALSLPSTHYSKRPIPRTASNSSLSSSGSSSGDLATPENSPSPSRAASLPSVYGLDDAVSLQPSEHSNLFDGAAPFTFNLDDWGPLPKTQPLWPSSQSDPLYSLS